MYINQNLEKYVEVFSEANEMIEIHPEMMADDVTSELLWAIRSGDSSKVFIVIFPPSTHGGT